MLLMASFLSTGDKSAEEAIEKTTLCLAKRSEGDDGALSFEGARQSVLRVWLRWKDHPQYAQIREWVSDTASDD
jgi:hypothetical protein